MSEEMECKWLMLKMIEDAEFAKELLYDTSRIFDTEDQARQHIADSHKEFVEKSPYCWKAVCGWFDIRSYHGPTNLIQLKKVAYIRQ